MRPQHPSSPALSVHLWGPRTSLECPDALPRRGRKQPGTRVTGGDGRKGARMGLQINTRLGKGEECGSRWGEPTWEARMGGAQSPRQDPPPPPPPPQTPEGETLTSRKTPPPAGRGEGPLPPGLPNQTHSQSDGGGGQGGGLPRPSWGSPPGPAQDSAAHRPLPTPSLSSPDARRPPLGFRWLQNLKVKS